MVDDVNGKALNFGLGRSLEENAGVIATNGHIHPKVLEVVKAVLERKHAEQEAHGGEVSKEHHSEPVAMAVAVAEPVAVAVVDFVAEPEAETASEAVPQATVPAQEEDFGVEEEGHGHSHDHDHGHSHSHGHSHGH